MDFTGDMETGPGTPGRGLDEGDGPPAGLKTLLGRPPAELPAVLLLVGAEAEREGWPAREAVRIAESLAHAGERVMLCDLSVEEPLLHQHLEMANSEGVADVVLFGASLRHVARRTGEAGFNFIPAGPPVAGAEEILEHPRWSRLIEAAAEARTKLLLYVPAASPGLATLAERVGIAVAFVEPGEKEAVLDSLPRECEVVPLVGPLPAGGLAGAGAAAPLEGFGDMEAIELSGDVEAAEATEPPVDAEPTVDTEATVDTESTVDTEAAFDIDAPIDMEEPAAAEESAGAGEIAAPAESADAGESADAEEPAGTEEPAEAEEPADGEPEVPRREAPTVAGGRPSSRKWPFVIAATVLIGLAVFGWYLTRGAETEPDPEPAAPEIATAAEETEPLPLAEELPYSVSIEAHRDFATAANRAQSLEDSWEGTGFFVAPIRVDTMVYYRVMAGPIAIEQSAIALMNELVAEGDKRAASAWDVRPTRLAYRVEETEDRQNAIDRREALLESGIPTYLVEMPYEGGPSRYRLYAGAYESPEQAEMMGELLAEADIEAELVDRTGRPPA